MRSEIRMASRPGARRRTSPQLVPHFLAELQTHPRTSADAILATGAQEVPNCAKKAVQYTPGVHSPTSARAVVTDASHLSARDGDGAGARAQRPAGSGEGDRA